VDGGTAGYDDILCNVGTTPGFSVVAEIPMRHGAVSGVAVSADGTRVMATHYGDNSVSLIDAFDRPGARTAIHTGEPFAIGIAGADGARAYVSTVSMAYDSVLVFDVNTNRVVAAHAVAHSVTDLVVSPDEKHVYISRNAFNGADVAVLDTETGAQDVVDIATMPGTTTECVRVSRDGRRVYVAANGPSTAALVVIDTHQKSVVSTLEIGSPIRDIALSPDGATAYVASCGPDFGAVLDVVDIGTTPTITSTCKVSEVVGFLAQLALSRNGERAYLVGDDSVTVLSTRTWDVVGAIMVGSQPSCVVESPDGRCLYIADYAGVVTVVEIGSTIAVGDTATPDGEPADVDQWVISDLLRLEATPT
jgi:DNA-binding beta-propeller fold protein YncE